MSLYRSVVRPLAFGFDPEWVHENAMRLLAKGLLKAPTFDHPRLRQELFGVDFPNPLGLAAGFDKNGLALDHWGRLGFGFAEVGTITFHPQSGNPRPRLFRLPRESALINRLGFNNDGASRVATRLAAAKPQIPIGINIGKSLIAELENAVEDYISSFRLLHRFGAYFAVNVSSPNTPGLRSLQDKEPLRQLLQNLRGVDPEKPLFVKVAPDMEPHALDDVIDVVVSEGVSGIIATNTTVARPGMQGISEEGGLSGKPLRDPSDRTLSHIAQCSPKSLLIIGVGGIFDGEDLYRKIGLGAHLAQVYTGWIYEGPEMVASSLRGLVDRMEREGIKSLDELRGALL